MFDEEELDGVLSVTPVFDIYTEKTKTQIE